MAAPGPTRYKGHEAVVRALLERGANPGARDDDQRTPLHLLGCPFIRLLGEGCTTRVPSQIEKTKIYKESEKRFSKTSEVR